MSSHILDMGSILFEGLQYRVFQFLVFLSILSLLLLAIFPDFEMLKFWSVNYICQVCKLYFYFGHARNFVQYLYLSVFSKHGKCPTFSFSQIYVVQPFYSKLYFVVIFGGKKSLFCDEKLLKIFFYLCIYFVQKTVQLISQKPY